MKNHRAGVLRNIRLLLLATLPLTTTLAQTPTSRIVGAANKFLSALNDKQRQTVLFAFDDHKQRARWSNFPIAMVPRGGIRLLDMNPEQRTAAMTLLASVLSERGFEKVQQIMEGDEANKPT